MSNRTDTSASAADAATSPAGALDAFNEEPAATLRPRLLACLGVGRWADDVLAGRPYAAREAVFEAADRAARHLDDAELASALAGHPRIGERASDPQHHAELSAREQAGVDPADAEVRAALAAGNAAYEERFDRVFLIRAAGRSAHQILAELRRRLDNGDETERAETVDQLREIALLRLEAVL
ncbi:2-oxo-4-hydroxy-4-carboxy-5-ureidoimidazoline decarboxylase [Terrabacter sp. MAHUQ-38]|uniref:2-oxo-4-hydroxy-4-carboxy-5-ureidoimidazoline decarboxylase n=1 Tax=unclassified Terrabacter TaxID=2630222 RepID=UPI00165E82D0|nr:2-oxo-4-hydroxy-4-carboxy-5-ureidoimidazoline decarboxylase [Terrabacter sp. MAHUQ-38]MBC9823074.1 2-oxo-4-hydroxy-4-carboxy-5-ureidoimidazoline decarboxylase [Terrabacter sp. MAHUQ-38]